MLVFTTLVLCTAQEHRDAEQLARWVRSQDDLGADGIAAASAFLKHRINSEVLRMAQDDDKLLSLSRNLELPLGTVMQIAGRLRLRKRPSSTPSVVAEPPQQRRSGSQAMLVQQALPVPSWTVRNQITSMGLGK